MLSFPATHLSLLDRIRSTDDGLRRQAFGDLAAGYWRPSYHYLRLHWHLQPDAAEDAVQSFFATAFEKGYVERYDPAQARFRTFLRTCLDRFVQNLQKAERAQKRGGHLERLSLDFPGAEREVSVLTHAGTGDPERFFRDETIRSLFARALDSLRASCESAGKSLVFRVFELHDLTPGPDASYAAIAAELGISVAQVTNYLHAARRQFRDHALGHLRDLVATEEEFRAEARDVFGLEFPA